jgi:hypothetical protein
MTVCICKKIQCPYFSDNTKNFGCQAYQSATACHLVRQFGIENKTEYALYAKDEDNLDSLGMANKAYFLNDEKYKSDLDFATKNPDWFDGWRVQPLPE